MTTTTAITCVRCGRNKTEVRTWAAVLAGRGADTSQFVCCVDTRRTPLPTKPRRIR